MTGIETTRTISPIASRIPAAVPQAVLFGLIAVVALIGNHLAISAIGVFGFAWLVVFAAATFYLAPAIALITLIIALLFQNTLLALLVGNVDTPQTFQTIQGTSFLVTLLLGGLSLTALLRHRHLMVPAQSRLLFSGVVFLGVVVIYLALGMLQVSAGSAFSYARLYFNGPLLLAAGLWLCWLTPANVLRSTLAMIATLLVVWGTAELLSAYTLYDNFNVNQFLALKYAMRPEASNFDSVKEVIELNTRSYLNLSGAFGLDLQMLRLKGPSMHAITFGYTLAFFALVMFMLRRPVLTIGCTAFAILVGAKGPLLMLIVTLLLYAGYRVLNYNARLIKIALFVFAAIYITVGVAYGFKTNDYHILGFIGGIKGFANNPIGHGIGVGGNLSDASYASRDFLSYQQLGSSDYALESALGVMLYQLGLATLVFAWFYRRLWRTVWDHAVANAAVAPRLMVMPLALGVLAVNTIFQEESLSPAGWGLWLLWSGIVLGWSRNQTQH